jgi:hypothetical protein
MNIWGFFWLCSIRMRNIFWGVSNLLCLFQESVIVKMAAVENHSSDSDCHFWGVRKVKTSDPTSDCVIVHRASPCKLQNDSMFSKYFCHFHFLFCIHCFYNSVNDLLMLFQPESGHTEYFMLSIILLSLIMSAIWYENIFVFIWNHCEFS